MQAQSAEVWDSECGGGNGVEVVGIEVFSFNSVTN